jgi:hypothetical protein
MFTISHSLKLFFIKNVFLSHTLLFPLLPSPMRPKARELARHGSLPVWLEESYPAGCDFVRDGRSMPPAVTDHTTFSGLGLIYY